jgi:branched-subunit amino acid transport protein
MTALAAAIAIGLLSWLFRVFFVVVVPARRLPVSVSQSLSLLAPATLASLVAVGLMAAVRGAPGASALLPVGVLVVAAWLAYRFRSLLLTVVATLVLVLAFDVLFV